jgi:ferrous iron transport protein A
MGITPGTVVEITAGCGGPVCLRARGACMSIGHGLAEKVLGRLAPPVAEPVSQVA